MLENWDPKSSCALSQLSLVAFKGKDIRPFLQGQMTLDIACLQEGNLFLAGYCNPKGRLLATPRFFVTSNEIWAIVPSDSVVSFINRLRLYTLRRDVTIESLPEWHLYGTLGALAPEKISQGPTVRSFTLSHTTLVLSTEDLPCEAPEASWWHEEALARQPWVFAATLGRFLPQSLNLDQLDAVSFTKGCYTGQEVVGRLHGSGRIARRMHLYTGPQKPLKSGEDVCGAAGIATATLVYASEGAYLFEVAQNNISETLDLGEGIVLRRAENLKEDISHG